VEFKFSDDDQHKQAFHDELRERIRKIEEFVKEYERIILIKKIFRKLQLN
jgi:hypothetical protein